MRVLSHPVTDDFDASSSLSGAHNTPKTRVGSLSVGLPITMDEIAQPEPVKLVRPYRRLQQLVIPEIPALPSGATTSQSQASGTPSSALPTQESLRGPRRSKWEKIDAVLETYGFDNLGDFLLTLFHPHTRDETDQRTPRHRAAVTKFLQGASTINMSHLIPVLYNHPQSRPKVKNTDQRAAAFSALKPLKEIRFAQPFMSAWATRIVGEEAYRRIGRLSKKSDDPSMSRTHVRASTNGRAKNVQVATWEHTRFTIQELIHKYSQDELIWHLTECMTAPRVKGKAVVRKRRPHPAVFNSCF